jgi:nitrite reductase/ring-hydroxylating ferredoxin subunit
MHVKTIGMALLVMVAALSALGCVENKSSISTAGASPVEGTLIDAKVTGNTVSIPLKSIDDNTNVQFKVNTEIGEISVMAYKLDDKIYVRSNVCPPCNSIGFALDKNTLVCDSCGTVFDATTGSGIEGGCVAYPKESIPYTVSGESMILKIDDVVVAHKKTVEVG